jgi:hypothetical protein
MPLPPLRVIAVMMHDEALDAVVVGINSSHRPTLSCTPRASSTPEPGTWPSGHGRESPPRRGSCAGRCA